MKKIFLVLLFVFSLKFKMFCQTTILIKGTLAANLPYKYAYLYYPASKNILVSEVLLGKFNFSVIKEEELMLANIFLRADSLTSNQVLSRVSNGNNLKLIAIENMEINVVTNVEETIVNGGSLNSALDDMRLAMKTLEYDHFFNKNSESPVALFFLNPLITISRLPFNNKPINCKRYYDMLSLPLKNSVKGKELLAKILNK